MWLEKVQTEELECVSEVGMAKDVQVLTDVNEITNNMESLNLVSERTRIFCRFFPQSASIVSVFVLTVCRQNCAISCQALQ